jgi:hypothetical protein
MRNQNPCNHAWISRSQKRANHLTESTHKIEPSRHPGQNFSQLQYQSSYSPYEMSVKPALSSISWQRIQATRLMLSRGCVRPSKSQMESNSEMATVTYNFSFVSVVKSPRTKGNSSTKEVFSSILPHNKTSQSKVTAALNQHGANPPLFRPRYSNRENKYSKRHFYRDSSQDTSMHKMQASKARPSTLGLSVCRLAVEREAE